jgi:hypothetical protein
LSLKIDTSIWEKLKENIPQKTNTKLEVGFFEDAVYGPENGNLPVATVAKWMNDGHDKDYPARPFMTDGFKSEVRVNRRVQRQLKESAKRILEGTSTETEELSQLGPQFKRMLRRIIIDWSEPPNSNKTIEEKGRNDPLVDTGHMRDSVDWKIYKKND